MSYWKNATGIYECDIRVEGVGRWHGSLTTSKKAEAEPRYEALRRLFREAKGPLGEQRRALIQQLREKQITVERIAAMVAHNEPLVPITPTIIHAWPTLDEASARYLLWVKANPERRDNTHDTAKAQLKRVCDFVSNDRRLGDVDLDDITTADLDAYQQHLMTEAKANTVTAYVNRVGALYRWVQNREERAAIEGRRQPRLLYLPLDPETQSRETTARDRWLTKAEASALIAVTPERLQCLVALGLLAGLRLGEALHLRTHVDVDLELGTLAIAPKLVRVDDETGREIWWKPKTRRSKRVVPISVELRPFVERQVAEFAGEHWLIPSLTVAGQPFSPSTANHHVTQIVTNAELIAGRDDPKGVVFHTLRHTFASWLAMAGVSLHTIAQLLGDTVKMAEDRYAHLSPDHKRLAVDALRNALSIESTATESATETRTTL